MQSSQSVPIAANPVEVGFADFNNDAKMDLAVPSGFGFQYSAG
jgi:hypothetical protein